MHPGDLKVYAYIWVIWRSQMIVFCASGSPRNNGLLQAKAAPGKSAGPAAPQQAGAKAKDGNSNAAAASSLLSTEALTDKVIEWAPEVHSCCLSLSAFRAYLRFNLICMLSKSHNCAGLYGSTHRIACLYKCLVPESCLV